jgi:hypothetical protein
MASNRSLYNSPKMEGVQDSTHLIYFLNNRPFLYSESEPGTHSTRNQVTGNPNSGPLIP